MRRGENTGEKRKKKNREGEQREGEERGGRNSYQHSPDLPGCRGSVRASSMTKCQLSPWATVNEEGFMGNIRD